MEIMNWKKRLLIDYLALGVGFTALLVGVMVTPKKGRIFVQQQSLEQGSAHLEMQYRRGSNDIGWVDFFLKTGDQGLRGLMEVSFRVRSRDFRNTSLEADLNNVEFGEKFDLSYCDPTVGRCFSKVSDGIYEFRVVLIGGINLSAHKAYKLISVPFKVTDYPPYMFTVGHGRIEDERFINHYSLLKDLEGEPENYDILSGIEGDLVLRYPENTPTPVVASPTPTQAVARRVSVLTTVDRSTVVCLADGRVEIPIRIEVRNWPKRGGVIEVYRREDGSDNEVLLYQFDRSRNDYYRNGEVILKRIREFKDPSGNVTGAVYKFYHRGKQEALEGKEWIFKVKYKTIYNGRYDGEDETDRPVAVSCESGGPVEGASLNLAYDPRRRGVKVLLRTRNRKIDSMDLVFGYGANVKVDEEAVFELNKEDLGGSAVVSKRLVNEPARRVLVSITDIRLSGDRDEYVVGWLKAERLQGGNVQNSNEGRVWLVFTPGSTVDTNVNRAGQDILTGVGDGVVIPEIRGGITPTSTPTPLPTSTPVPVPTSTPVPSPTETPQAGGVLISMQLPVKLMHRIENEGVVEEDYRKLPVMLFVGSGDKLRGIMWGSLVYDQIREPVVWAWYDYSNLVLRSTDQLAYISSSELEGADYYIIKVAGFLSRRISKREVNVECDGNGGGNTVCRFQVKENLMLVGDINAAGVGRGIEGVEPVEDDLVKAYQKLFGWDENVTIGRNTQEYKYLVNELLWFGDDVINGFDTGKYARVLGDTNFYIDWFEGKKAGVYSYIPLKWGQVGNRVKFTKVKWFNLLDADGNRYLNSIDWSIVHDSFQQIGQGDLYEMLNEGGE